MGLNVLFNQKLSTKWEKMVYCGVKWENIFTFVLVFPIHHDELIRRI